MEINGLKIIAPEGMECCIENNEVKFRPVSKKLTYDDIAKELFKDNITYYTDSFCNIKHIDGADINYNDINNCTSEKQLKKLLAINQLMNVAKYLNKDWQPDWNDYKQNKFCFNIEADAIAIDCRTESNRNIVYFKSYKLAKQAIDILGEDTIKLALCTDY